MGRAAALKMASYWEVLLRQPPRVVFRPFAFNTFAGLHQEAVDLLKSFHGLVSQASPVHDDMIRYSTLRRVSFTIARAVERRLATTLSYWGLDEGS